MACKSKTHRQYRDAVEGLYIQTSLAQRDLTNALVRARAERPDAPGDMLAVNQHLMREAVLRIEFGISEWEAADAAVGGHLRRGCGNL